MALLALPEIELMVLALDGAKAMAVWAKKVGNPSGRAF
jgi:hypothetical protein